MPNPTPSFPRIPKASRTKVWEAADAILLGTGERPTVEGIRHRLGGGSPNSVTAYLNEWYRELAERLSAAQAPIEGVPIAALALLRDLWHVAREGEGKAGGSAHREADGLAEAEVAALRAQVKALEALNQELRRHRATTEQALAEAKALLAHREAAAAEDRDRLVALEAALTAKRMQHDLYRAGQRRKRKTASLEIRSVRSRHNAPAKSAGSKSTSRARNKRGPPGEHSGATLKDVAGGFTATRAQSRKARNSR